MLRPRPTTTATAPAGTPVEGRLGQHAGQLLLAHQDIVGPLEHRTHADHPTAGLGRRQGHGRRTKVQLRGIELGPEEHRSQQRRTRGSLPAAVQTAPAGTLMFRHGDRPFGRPQAGLPLQIGVGRVDLFEPVYVPGPTPHGRHHTVRAIVMSPAESKGPLC